MEMSIEIFNQFATPNIRKRAREMEEAKIDSNALYYFYHGCKVSQSKVSLSLVELSVLIEMSIYKYSYLSFLYI